MRPADAQPHPPAEVPPAVALRSPAQVMRLARLGRFFATRLSFMPTLLRRMGREGAQVRRALFELDARGVGRAVYSVKLGGRTYSLVAFAHDLPDALRSDRVIAEAWDATFVLYDGMPDAATLDRLEANAPRQEAGRYGSQDLVLSRANKSVRMFDHVVGSLAAGRQPDDAMLAEVGYLMRTTAVYGNGKFGIADRARLADRPEMTGSFQAEMLAVYLIRGFTHDLVEHLARARDPERAVPLDRHLKRYLGVGNSTGLGMAPFLIGHPVLINNWILARETALARVRAVARVDDRVRARFLELLARAAAHVREWQVADARQSAANRQLAQDLAALAAAAEGPAMWRAERPWDALVRWAEATLSVEGQELLVGLIVEPYGDLVDGLTDCMTAAHEGAFEPAMRVATLRDLVAAHYDWALAVDFAAPEATRLFWYVSEEKLEPRLGDRTAEPGADKEMPLAIARDIQALAAALAQADPQESAAEFVLRHPELRHLVRRVQTVARHPYGEIRDNLIAADCLPIDLLRCKLSFFGAAKFDPKSDRWTRIAMYQGAPLPDELGTPAAEDWCLPVLRPAPAMRPAAVPADSA